jgi:hypothetical protein
MPTTIGELLFDLACGGVALGLLILLVIGCERTFL